MESSPGSTSTKSSKQRQKRYHRRSPWACDECRLRKRKCDGTQPCNGCKNIDRECTYDFKSKPIPAPKQRIRILEERLRSARSFLNDIKSKGSPGSDLDIDAMLEALDCTLPEDIAEREDQPANESSKHVKLHSMLNTSGQLISHGPWATSFFGPSSGFYFIWRTLELFVRNPKTTISPIITRAVIMELFDVPLPSIEALGMADTNYQILPSREVTFSLLDGLFSRCHPLLQFLHEEDFRQMVIQTYSEPRLQFAASDHRFMPLLHAALSLAYLFQIPYHQAHGCHAAVKEATKNFFTARNHFDLTQCNDLISLQTLLCFIVFLVSTSRLSSAHTHIGIACSSALRLGLHSDSDIDTGLSAEQRQTRLRILAVILKLDIYASLVLGLPAFLSLDDVEPNVLNCLTQIPSKPANDSDISFIHSLQFQASTKQLELFRITTLGIKAIFNASTEFEDVTDNETGHTASAEALERLGADFRSWAKGASSLIADMFEDESLSNSRFELEMTYYFCQIIVYQPFLHYLREMATGVAISRTQSRYALTCIKIASNTITRAQSTLQREGLVPASWTSIYTIFLSVSCLMFLVAAHKGTSKPGEAWRKAEVGIRLLASTSCVDDGATRCLRILKMLVNQLSYTVYFDIDQIEATTARICRYHNTPNLDHGMTPDNSSPTDMQYSSTKLPILPTPWFADAAPQFDAGDDYTASSFGHLDADQIFAKAQEIPFVGTIDFFNNLGEQVA